MRNILGFYVMLISIFLMSCTQNRTRMQNQGSAQSQTGTQSQVPNQHLILDSTRAKGLSRRAASEKIATSGETAKKTILFYGNSITAGYGLADISLAFPALIQHKIDSLSLPYHCINGGLSGETSAGGKNRINWVLKNKVDVFVLELGANDGLRGIPLEQTQANLQSIVEQVRATYPKAKMLMCGMLVPPNMGEAYSAKFKNIFSKLAKNNKMQLLPFLLEGVAGHPKLNQEDGIHPTALGSKMVAENVWSRLRPML